jgi:hypothetical protein
VQGQSEVDMSVYRCAFRGGGRREVDLTVYRLAFRGGGRREIDLAMDQPVCVQTSSLTLVWCRDRRWSYWLWTPSGAIHFFVLFHK